MADRPFLDWPFFDDRHRAFAADLEACADRTDAVGLHGDHDLDGDCRTILKALAPAVPHLIPAAHKGDMGGCSFFGFRDDGSRFLLMNIFGGGWGARGWKSRAQHSWKHRYYDKLSSMTPEDRERFKARMREKWRCGAAPEHGEAGGSNV